MIIELNTLSLNKFTLNSGYIFVDDLKIAKKIRGILSQLNICHVTIIVKSGDVVYYGFKVFRIKKNILKLCVELKEVFK